MLRPGHKLVLAQIALSATVGCTHKQPQEPSAAPAPTPVLKEPSSVGLPRPVLAALEADYRNASIVHHWRDTVDGQPVHEVTLRQAGRCFDVSLTAQGKVVEVERPISGHEIPTAVSAAMGARHPGFRLVKVEEVRPVRGGLFYEVVLVTTGVSVKSQYDQDGQLIFEVRRQDSK